MEIFSIAWFGALASIVVIDILLAGDNAVVIALATRNLPPHLRKKAIIWGTFGAIFVRSALTFFVAILLKIPAIALVGGLVLFYISWELLGHNKDKHGNQTASTFWQAMRVIIIADTAMALDNVLAVAGAARGDWLLIVLGLIISIPIVMYGSVLTLKIINKFPSLVIAGVLLLACIAGRIILDDTFIAPKIEAWGGLLEWTVIILFGFSFTAIAYFGQKKLAAAANSPPPLKSTE